MTTDAGPLRLVDDLASLIEQDAEQAERHGHLTDRVVEAITEAGLYRMVIPRSLGGRQDDPVALYETVEAVARLDGSTGWCQFIQSGAPIIGAALGEDAAEEVFADAGTRMAGAVFPFGRAVATEGGVVVSGRWPYASGSCHATWFLAFCITFDGDTPRPGPGEMPELRAVVVPRDQVTLHETWDVSGLAGTGSNDIELSEVVVPYERSWVVGPIDRNRHYRDPMYAMPLFAYFAWPAAAAALGIARAAIDAVTELAERKTPAGQQSTLRERPSFHAQLGQATAAVGSGRAWLHETVAQAHDAAVDGRGSSLEDRAHALLAATEAVQRSRQAVELAYLAGGGTANYRSSRLQRCLRDIHAITQHPATSHVQYEEVGRLLTGHPPQNGMLLL